MKGGCRSLGLFSSVLPTFSGWATQEALQLGDTVKVTESAGEINNPGETKAGWTPQRQEQMGRTGTKVNSSQRSVLQALLFVAAVLLLNTSRWNGPGSGPRGQL